MACLLQLLLDGFVAVEFSIDNDSGSAVFTCNRLISRREVDDAEARASKSNSPAQPDPVLLPIGPAVVKTLGRTLD